MAKLSDFREQKKNANKHTQRGRGLLQNSIQRDGYTAPMIAAQDGELFIGSHRYEVSSEVFGPDVEPIIIEIDGTRPVIVKRTDIKTADDPKAVRLGLADNRIAQLSLDWDVPTLQGFDLPDLDLVGFNEGELIDLKVVEPQSKDAEPQPNRADELQEIWQVQTGDLWQIGEHRLICGDCTDPAVVERVMGGEKAILVHADPPYGMGKENEGIENDNLYREKLDEFQMMWWQTCRPFVKDNGSAYIWGNSDDLWRLWYLGGLRDSERLTFRNEIVWDKQDDTNPTLRVNGKTFKGMRSHYQSERCLFFMLGEQGFNNNADNYWNGWDGIKNYLRGEADKVKMTPDKLQEVCGVGMYTHWFTESQWTFITEKHYKELQSAYSNDAFKKDYDAFKKDYDELKKEFYSTRAYFDNTHENMTDVWHYERVTGGERGDHPTPKPTAMVERILFSSCPADGVVYVPFGGTLPELRAGQNTGRIIRAVEKEPKWCAVGLQAMQDAFPELDIKRIE